MVWSKYASMKFYRMMAFTFLSPGSRNRFKKTKTYYISIIIQSSNQSIQNLLGHLRHQVAFAILHLWSCKGTRPKLSLWPTGWSAWKTRRPLADASTTKRCTPIHACPRKIDIQSMSEVACAKLGIKAARRPCKVSFNGTYEDKFLPSPFASDFEIF